MGLSAILSIKIFAHAHNLLRACGGKQRLELCCSIVLNRVFAVSERVLVYRWMSHSALGSFYRRGSSVTGRVLAPDPRDSDGNDSIAGGPDRDMFMTPPFTPTGRWSSDSPHTYDRASVSVNQKLDRVLVMFDEMRQQVERDSVETREQLSILQDEIKEMKEKQSTSVAKTQKKIPSVVSVRLLHISSHCTILYMHSLNISLSLHPSFGYRILPVACCTKGT